MLSVSDALHIEWPSLRQAPEAWSAYKSSGHSPFRLQEVYLITIFLFYRGN